MNFQFLINKNFFFIYLFILIIFSFFFNQYHAYIGVLPIDSFLRFNSGYDVLNGSYPFKDFWEIKGSFLDIIQAIFFKFFGVSWFVYAAHASFFNALFAVSTFLIFNQLKLKIEYCFYYSLLVSILMYPTYGTPFTDHHASILSMISIYLLISAMKTQNNIFWFLIPVFLFISFFSKQTPSAYVGLLIILAIFYYLLFNFNIKILLNLFLGSLTIFFIFFCIILIYEIPIKSIIIQQFLYPIHLGSTRTEWLMPLEFKRFVLRYKLHYLALYFPIYILIKQSLINLRFLRSVDAIIILILIGILFIFISHQLLTINGMFIFFLIPIFSGFAHIFLQKYMFNKTALILILILSLASTLHYYLKYTMKRETLALKNVDLKNSVDAGLLDKKLKNLKWITYHYPNNPNDEIKNLNTVINIIKNDNRNKMLVTDYQFISVILSINDNAAANAWWRHHLYPEPDNKYFDIWKNFLLKKIKNKRIEVVYTIHPLEGENDIFEGVISKKCFLKKNINKILDIHIINPECEEIKATIKP